MENPKVSIITTTYNDKENLKKIIAQVKKQDYDNIEYVIVDGGSADGTGRSLRRQRHISAIG